MRYKHITVITDHLNADLVAEAMFDAGAEGVDILDRQDFLDLLKSDVEMICQCLRLALGKSHIRQCRQLEAQV